MTTSITDLPKITVITPSYNSGRFIEQTICSVLNQKYPKLEYLVIDGGSTDETISILQKYSNSLTWISEKDRGQSHAINKGIEYSTGEVIAYLNADDIYEPGALVNIGNYFFQHHQAYWVTGIKNFGYCGVVITFL